MMAEIYQEEISDFINSFLEITIIKGIKKIYLTGKRKIIYTFNNDDVNMTRPEFAFQISHAFISGINIFNIFCPNEKTKKIILQADDEILIITHLRQEYILIMQIQQSEEDKTGDYLNTVIDEIDSLIESIMVLF